MTESKKIIQNLQSMPFGKPFSAKALSHLGSTENIRQVLARLVKKEDLHRVARGVFVRPKIVAGIGEALPSSWEVVEVIAQSTGETFSIHGAEAARQLQLTTQVPMQIIYYTSGSSRILKIGSRCVQLKHVSPRKLKLAGTLAGTVVVALSYLGRGQVTSDTIETIKNRLPENEFATLMQKTEHMPNWMAHCFHRYQNESALSPPVILPRNGVTF